MVSQSRPEVRLIEADELARYMESVAIPFLEPMVTDADRESASGWKDEFEIGRTWAVEDHGRFVGNAANSSRSITLPAAPGAACPDVPFTAVTAVGVHPTHRRRGLLRRLMGAMLADGRARGEVVAGLTASESSIYGRFGFGWAISGALLRIDARHAALRHPAPELDIELLYGEAAAKPARAMFERARLASPGQVSRDEPGWSDRFADRRDHRGGGSARTWAVCDGGVASWRVKRTEDPDGTHRRTQAHVSDLLAETAEIEAALWKFILDIDLVHEVEVYPRPVDDPFRHRLVDPRRLETKAIDDFLWLRILDTPGALTARGYLRPGRLVLHVQPPSSTPTDADGVDGPDPAAGRWTLEVGPDGSTCRPAHAGEATDLTLGVAALSALFMGEAKASILGGAGAVQEERPGALLEADILFAPNRQPSSQTGF